MGHNKLRNWQLQRVRPSNGNDVQQRQPSLGTTHRDSQRRPRQPRLPIARRKLALDRHRSSSDYHGRIALPTSKKNSPNPRLAIDKSTPSSIDPDRQLSLDIMSVE